MNAVAESVSNLQAALGIDFENPELLQHALTHPSYVNEHPDENLIDNQRLEFLGDAVLDFIAGELLYHKYPDAPEGRMTRLRAALVRTETLASFAKVCGVNDALRVGRGEEESGGRERENNLCAAFEAVVGALYLDHGIDAVREFMQPHFERALEQIVKYELDKDAKSKLQEWSQAHRSVTPNYQTVSSRGPDHAKEFTVAVYLGEERLAEGVGTSKQSAAQAAARKALETLLEEA